VFLNPSRKLVWFEDLLFFDRGSLTIRVHSSSDD
jgi:hypothetical protein